MVGVMQTGDLRVGNADRERVAERVRIALDEGRLNLYEYDERLREAYAAKTYTELERLLADLPTPAPAVAVHAGTTADQPGPDGRYPNATRRWLVGMWAPWLVVVGICIVIWAVISLASDGWTYFWPGWVAGPWGVVLLAHSVIGLANGEPQRWAAKRARTRIERELSSRAKKITR